MSQVLNSGTPGERHRPKDGMHLHSTFPSVQHLFLPRVPSPILRALHYSPVLWSRQACFLSQREEVTYPRPLAGSQIQDCLALWSIRQVGGMGKVQDLRSHSLAQPQAGIPSLLCSLSPGPEPVPSTEVEPCVTLHRRHQPCKSPSLSLAAASLAPKLGTGLRIQLQRMEVVMGFNNLRRQLVGKGR